MAPPNLEAPARNNSYTILPSAVEEEEEEETSFPDEDTATIPKKSDEDVCSDDIEVVVPPDGGWGWVIVFASFMCNVIVDGIIFSYGMFLEGIAIEFGVTRARAALVGSLMSGFYLIVGPFASAIANKFGFRLVAILGSVLGAIAFVLSSFATNVEFLCITYGLLGGIGFGFIYVPAVITIGFYFEKWRALATGIGVCGSGIGTFLFAPLSKSLINTLGWRNALLIQAAIVLSCVIFGILFRPLKPRKLKDLDKEEDREIKAELMLDYGKTYAKLTDAMKHHSHRYSLSSLHGKSKDHLKLCDVYHTIHHMPLRNDVPINERRLSVPFMVSQNEKKAVLPEDMNRPLYRDDIFFGQSLTRLPQYTSQRSFDYNLAVTRLPPKQDILEEKTRSCKLYPEAVRRVLTTMLDFSLLKSPSFLILAIGGFFTMMGFYVPFMYLVERATGHMPEQTAVLLISTVGIANTMGRVLCGVLSSFPSVNALFVTNTALTIGGLITILSGISLTQEYQFFYSVVFGLAISCFASLRSIIVVDLLGLEKLTNAFGLLLLFQGVAAVIGAPLAGAFTDITGSFDATFYLSGSMILISAIMCYPLNWINQWERRRSKNLESI
ncbi:hypothetical protein ABEB36_012332 [Hypothenemus hampei]|uniref:Major facilitator superfamily (MFS) profile domain-containing protein n=1 Tax=Hypothenemus hampei TaxID=57062 RepID=A0ABD1EB58_HYPHA